MTDQNEGNKKAPVAGAKDVEFDAAAAEAQRQADSKLLRDVFAALGKKPDPAPAPGFWLKLSMAVTACLAIGEVSSKAISSALSSFVPEGVVKSVLFPLLLVAVIGGIVTTGKIAWWSLGPKDVKCRGRALGVAVMFLCCVSAYFGARYEAGRSLAGLVAWREEPGGCAAEQTGGHVTLRLPEKALGAANGFGFTWCRTGTVQAPAVIRPSVERGITTEVDNTGECLRVHLDSVPRTLSFQECADASSAPATVKDVGAGKDEFATKFWKEFEWYERWAF